MARSRLLALGFCIAFVGAMAATAISSSKDRDALGVHDLLHVEARPGESTSPLDDHLGFAFEVFGGARPWTQRDLDERFTPGFAAGFGVDRLTEATADAVAARGTTQFVRTLERESDSIRALGVAEDGTPMIVWIQTTSGDRIDSLLLEVVPSPPRLPAWRSVLLILAAALFGAAAAVTTRRPRQPMPAALLLGSAAASAATLVLADATMLYTIGRIAPAVLVPIGVRVLVDSSGAPQARWIAPIALASMLVAGTAPFVRDPTLIGHPRLVGALGDSESAYRTLLVGAALLTSLAVGAATVTAARHSVRTSRRRRPVAWLAGGVGALWTCGALGSAIDQTAGAARWAAGPFTAVTLTALAAVPVVAIVAALEERWDRADIAALVVDLDAHDAQLERAVARALDDRTLTVATSPDGKVLLDQRGDAVEPDALPAGRTMTEIRTGTRLVGGLVHDASLRDDPDRLRAVAAAAGMALEVDRLNRQVSAQLSEVSASRSRIVQAGDSARRQLERDLHDGAQQRLVAVGVQLQRARRKAESENEPGLATLIENATSEVRRSIDDIRAVSRGFQPALLAERGLGPAVDALAERSPVPVRIDIPPCELGRDVSTTAYFVIAEALTNISKHADATLATVSVSRANGLLSITVSDDGVGGATVSTGSGLEGLVDRVAAASGTIDITSDRRGTTLETSLPCA